jgi:hypothetical protein
MGDGPTRSAQTRPAEIGERPSRGPDGRRQKYRRGGNETEYAMFCGFLCILIAIVDLRAGSGETHSLIQAFGIVWNS